MIVAANTSGRLGNRLVFFTYVYAVALHTGHRLLFLTGKDILDLLDINREKCFNPGITVVNRIRIVDFLLRCAQSYHERFSPINGAERIVKNYSWVRSVRGGGGVVHFMFDWFLRDNDALVAEREKIVAAFKVKDMFIKRPRGFFSSLVDGAITIGVHIRRGDYRSWANGRFCFSDKEYLGFFRQLVESFVIPIRFLIVSDEDVDIRMFCDKGIDAHRYKGSDYREDMMLLSLCDYVMGPVSTFSWWAAYYGGAKYCAIRDCNQVLSKDSFKSIRGGEFDVV